MKKIAFTLMFLFIALDVFSQGTMNSETTQNIVRNGVSLGSLIAAITSWDRNRSILWAILHALFSWLYVIYFVFTRKT